MIIIIHITLDSIKMIRILSKNQQSADMT